MTQEQRTPVRGAYFAFLLLERNDLCTKSFETAVVPMQSVLCPLWDDKVGISKTFFLKTVCAAFHLTPANRSSSMLLEWIHKDSPRLALHGTKVKRKIKVPGPERIAFGEFCVCE